MPEHWFIVGVNLGSELLACERVVERAQELGMADEVRRASSPVDDGNLLFPGYVFVQMKPTVDALELVRSTEDVIGFTSAKSEGVVSPDDPAVDDVPTPITDDEFKRLLPFL